MIHTVVKNGIWFCGLVFLVRSWQLLECFLTKKTLQPKTSKRATLVLSAKPLPLYSQPNHAKLKEDSLKRRVRMEKITQNQKFGYQLPHSFFFFFPFRRLKQAVVDHPFHCPVKNKHILFNTSMCSIQGQLNHSNPCELPPAW